MPGAGRDGVEQGVPLGVGEDGQVDRGAVRARAAALDSGVDLAGGDGDRADHALAGVGASAREASGVQGGVLQGGHPCLAPPGRGEGAAAAGGRTARAGERGLMPAFQCDEFGEVGVGQFGQGCLAGADDGVGEGALGFEQLRHLVLHGALRE